MEPEGKKKNYLEKQLHPTNFRNEPLTNETESARAATLLPFKYVKYICDWIKIRIKCKCTNDTCVFFFFLQHIISVLVV